MLRYLKMILMLCRLFDLQQVSKSLNVSFIFLCHNNFSKASVFQVVNHLVSSFKSRDMVSPVDEIHT
ncbi:hypothetical protein LWI28_013152 [Acer negundo]|uniref:Uncharacterized protein n=1 Tax=Acer negundo TaxID=4023 RepID=A0AAD5IQ87_ACENE|nr:hypothetical protein LWI28_013152 [Acer negundo]